MHVRLIAQARHKPHIQSRDFCFDKLLRRVVVRISDVHLRLETKDPHRGLVALGLTLRSVPVAQRSSRHTSMTAASPVAGDVVKCKFTLRPAPEPSTYDQGVVSFVLGGGNYVTGLHETVTTMEWLGLGLGLG